MVVDERDHHFARRSSSAWAEYADALRKISLARIPLGLADPPAQRLVSTAQLLGHGPDRRPLRRMLRACSRTDRTARPRTSGEYRLGRATESILSTNGLSDELGTVQ
jgi:hypothetical protein